jgi:catechol 2,3-dioxygenase-like lactoylglutathione lyase family enzyme
VIRGGLVTLAVKDVSASVRFYVETLGMKLVEERGARGAVIDAGDGLCIGLERRDTAGSSAHVGLYVKVPLREAVAIFENRGVSFDVKTEGTVPLAYFRDPDGNVLFLAQSG